MVRILRTDPVLFVFVLRVQSPLLVVEGDAGDKLTKVGVTFLDEKKTQQFAALLVYRGKDDYTDLDALKPPLLFPSLEPLQPSLNLACSAAFHRRKEGQ